MDLNERKKQILKSIIDAYIDSGEPIGSKFLTQHSQIPLSPATIRNEMSELESMGYLDKPHTSAGRIPSDAAYRFYVEQLMESYRLTFEEVQTLNDIMRFKMSELDKLIGKAGRIMSDVTKYATFAITEKKTVDFVTRYDTMLIDSESFLLVMVTSQNEVKSKHVHTGMTINSDSLEIIKKSLNNNLTNIPLGDISLPVMMKAEEDMGIYGGLTHQIMRIAYEAVSENSGGTLKIDGLTNLLNYPEFNDIDKLRDLMEMVETKRDDLTKFMENAQDLDGGKPRVFIGDDMNNPTFADTSVVFCTVPVGNTNAIIGILGPKRMDYKRVFSSLKQFSENMEKALSVPQLEEKKEE